MAVAAATRLEPTADELWARHRLTQRHPSLAARRVARFTEVERELAGEIARRTGLDPDLDPYPAVVVAGAVGALKVSLSVWQERGRPGPLVEVVDDAFAQLAAGFDLPVPVSTARH